MGIDVGIRGGKVPIPPPTPGPAKTGTTEESTKINETIIAAKSFFLIA